jgi:carbon monoxide dehydrogenase subunit G
MASIQKEISLRATPEAVWDVVRDVGAVHTRFAPGFVVDVVMEEGARLVTFGNGMVAREVIVDVDDTGRRLAYSVRGDRLSHHNASFQVVPDGDGARLIWIADLLPHEAAASVAAMMDAGLVAAKKAMEGRATTTQTSAAS